MSSYGWTIEQVNSLTVPELIAITGQIKKYPPTNMILTEFLKGLGKGNGKMNVDDVDKQLSNFQNVKRPDAKKSVFTKTGNRVVKMIVKKTGKRVI